MEERPQVSLTIDGQEVSAPEGATILEAARSQGIAIPTLCHHAALTPWGGCRLCVVEVDGAPRLVAACVMPVRKGMEVVTDNPRITQARRTVLEFLFAERAHYCMYCAQSGDCELQALAYALGMDHLTVPTLDQVFPVDATHPTIALDHNRCVLCGRCVRACREIVGVRTLDFQYRGGANTIGADLDGPLGRSSCVSCGACLQVCPTGAIFHRDRTHHAILGKDRDWNLLESFCPRCQQHCHTSNLVRGESLLKIQAPLPSPIAWQGQLCRKGRFEPFVETHPRLLKPMLRAGDGWQEATWEEALAGAAQGLAQGRNSLLGLISSDCCNEEISAFLRLMGETLIGAEVDTLDGALYRTLAGAGLDKLHEAPWEAALTADLILVVGAALQASHPMLESLVRRAMLENGTRLALLGQDPRLGAAAHYHLPAPAQDLLRLALDLAGDKTPPAPGDGSWQAQDWTGLAQTWAGAANPIIVVGEQLSGLGQTLPLVALAKLAKAKGNLAGGQTRLIILKPCGNSLGAWTLGAVAEQGPASNAAAGLVCLDGEQGPPPSGLPRFLALITPYIIPAWADLAQVLLPKPTWLESTGAYLAANGQGMVKPAVLARPPDVPPAQETLDDLARRLAS